MVLCLGQRSKLVMAAAYKDSLENDNLGFQVRNKEGERWGNES